MTIKRFNVVKISLAVESTVVVQVFIVEAKTFLLYRSAVKGSVRRGALYSPPSHSVTNTHSEQGINH